MPNELGDASHVPSNRRGCIALAVSPDLERWEIRAPFWSPQLYYTHECPDLFGWNDSWVLVYSTFSERTVTHYRISQSLDGPWLAPTHDTFDTRAFYAAKTASDGNRRFVFGWNPTREGECDSGKWEWAGSMVVHEVKSDGQGGLAVNVPPEVEKLFTQSIPLAFKPQIGKWRQQESAFTAQASDGFSLSTLGDLPDCCEVNCTIAVASGTRSCGLMLHIDAQLENYYQLRWEPGRARIVFDRWPRPGDEPFMLECPLQEVRDDSVRLKVFLDGSVVIVYINDTVALSCRAYDHQAGQLGLFVAEGKATFSDITVRELAT